MTNILFVYENEMPTVAMAKEYWMNLPNSYNIVANFISIKYIKTKDVNWCDVLILIRPNNSLSWKIAKEARISGRFVITMCDDNLLNLPKEHPQLFWQKTGLIKALNYSSVILSSSKYLVDQMSLYTADKRGSQMDTIVKHSELIVRDYEKDDHKPVKLVYAAGGGQHESMFEKFVLPALKCIAKKLPRSFSLTFVSVHPNCKGLENEVHIEFLNGMPLLEYRKFMEESKFDIGIAPLEDNDFTKCKYFNKYLEYTLSGIIGIYSNVEPYLFVVRDGINGLLADNNSKSWEEKLTLAIKDRNVRISCAKNAQYHVSSNFTEKSIMNKLFTDIPELHDGSKEDHCSCTIKHAWLLQYNILKCVEYIYKTFFYLQNEDISSVKRRAIARIRMLLRSINTTK